MSGEQDCEEQRRENDTPPVTVEGIEAGVPNFDCHAVARFEQGKVDRSRMTDLELCELLECRILPRYARGGRIPSIYGLPETERSAICEMLWKESRQGRYRSDGRSLLSGKYVTESQLRRCLCVK